jgi:2-polyprenyl-3-methyl-5-hydroxy-6-metoxy-1,4-benzoquinol methylase
MYQDKSKKYFSNPRLDLISLIPKNENNKILEIGAGSCDTLVEIKKLNLAQEVVGVELMKLEDSQQNNSWIDRLIIGNIENIELDLPQNHFDVIICGDVLEHLVDPWSTLNKLHKHLKQSGVIIISVPNIREYHILFKILIAADFKYGDKGILDRTHLRFFCKKNIISLLTSTMYTLISIHSIFKLERAQRQKRIFNRLTFGLLSDLLTAQYVVVAEKRSNIYQKLL